MVVRQSSTPEPYTTMPPSRPSSTALSEAGHTVRTEATIKEPIATDQLQCADAGVPSRSAESDFDPLIAQVFVLSS